MSLLSEVFQTNDAFPCFINTDNFVELIDTITAIETTDHGEFCTETNTKVCKTLIVNLTTSRTEDNL